MKKRKILAIVMLILLLSGIKTLPVQAVEISADYEIDEMLLDFMRECSLPESVEAVESEVTLTYQQRDEKGAGFSVESIEVIRERHGFSAKLITYRNESGSFHAFLDARFDWYAEVTEEDCLTISYPIGIGIAFNETQVQWLSLANNDGEWFVKDTITASSTDGNGFMIPLDEIAKHGNSSRILLYINGTASTNFDSATPNMEVEWFHRFSSTEQVFEAVLTPSTILTQPVEDTNAFPWKVIFIVLLIDLDIVAVIIIIHHIQKKRRIKQESPEQQAAIADEAEAELQQNLKLKPEDVEYLKEIGYFDPNKK